MSLSSPIVGARQTGWADEDDDDGVNDDDDDGVNDDDDDDYDDVNDNNDDDDDKCHSALPLWEHARLAELLMTTMMMMILCAMKSMV